MAGEAKKDLHVLLSEEVKKLEQFDSKDLPGLEKAMKDDLAASQETSSIGHRLASELRKLGEGLPENDWALVTARLGESQDYLECLRNDLVEKVLQDGTIDPLRKYQKEETHNCTESLRKLKAAIKHFEVLTEKRTTQSMAKKTTTNDMLLILKAEKQEAELKTAMLKYCKTYDGQRCYKLLTFITDFMRGQQAYHDASAAKVKELALIWKPVLEKRAADFDVPKDPEDRIEKKGPAFPAGMEKDAAAARVHAAIRAALPPTGTAPAIHLQVPGHTSMQPKPQPSPAPSSAPLQSSQSSAGTAPQKTEAQPVAAPVKPVPKSVASVSSNSSSTNIAKNAQDSAAAEGAGWKHKDAARSALVSLRERLTDLSPGQVSAELARIIALFDDAPRPANGGPQPGPVTTSPSGRRLSVGSLSEFISEDKPQRASAAGEKVNSSIDEILAGFLDDTKKAPPAPAAPAPVPARASNSSANITDELMALINAPNSPKNPSG